MSLLCIAFIVFHTSLCANGTHRWKKDFDISQIVFSFPRRQYMYRPDQPNTVINAGVAKEAKITYPKDFLKTKLKNLLKIKEKFLAEMAKEPDPEFQ